MHYCGGELEKVSYILKDNSGCCGSEESEESMDEGCCKNEDIVLKNNTDFTLQQNIDFNFSKTFTETLFVSLPFFNKPVFTNYSILPNSIEAPPPKQLASLIISTSVIRI